MSTHGSRDQKSDVPNAEKGNYGTTVFGVDVAEATVVGEGVSPGWVKVKTGEGEISDLIITAEGTGYANADVISVAAATGANAAANLETDASGNVATITFSSFGGTFHASPNVTITTSGGTGANLTPVVGGRAGRTQYETLAFAKIQGDSVSFSDANTATIANSTGSSDDGTFADS